MPAIKQLARHIYALGHLVEHPPINVGIHGHDVVRGREGLPTSVAVLAGGGGEEGRGVDVGVDGDVVVLEVVVFVVHEGAFVDASGFEIPIAQQPKVILRQLQLHHPVVRHSLEHGALPHVRHHGIHAPVDGSIGRRRQLGMVATMVRRPAHLHDAHHLLGVAGRVVAHAPVPELLVRLLEQRSAASSRGRVGRVRNAPEHSSARAAAEAAAASASRARAPVAKAPRPTSAAPAPPSRIGEQPDRLALRSRAPRAVNAVQRQQRVGGIAAFETVFGSDGHVVGMGATVTVREGGGALVVLLLLLFERVFVRGTTLVERMAVAARWSGGAGARRSRIG
mmetsp:Transcript_10038/g.17599  ORF Transcript_10038/g.17599 Transcript_10038/m.17599 type:complete len:337 (-) Transcript_10038:798-1808(-)